jgi:TetR/AcrR family transcriptional repressor of nem operon
LSRARANMAATLRNDEGPPLERLRAYFDNFKDRLSENSMRNGCLFGNFTAEASDYSEPIRRRVVEIFGEVRESIAYCLRAAVAAGEVNASLDCDEVAGFILSSLQGAILLSKAYRTPEPVERFKRVLFSTVLTA